jgi:hypothetical protein
MLIVDRARVADMADALRAHPVASRLLHPAAGAPEVSLFWHDPEHDVDRRGRVDFLRPRPRRPADPRRLQDDARRRPRRPRPVGANFGYHSRRVVPRPRRRARARPSAPFVFVFQETAPPYLVHVVELDGDLLAMGEDPQPAGAADLRRLHRVRGLARVQRRRDHAPVRPAGGRCGTRRGVRRRVSRRCLPVEPLPACRWPRPGAGAARRASTSTRSAARRRRRARRAARPRRRGLAPRAALTRDDAQGAPAAVRAALRAGPGAVSRCRSCGAAIRWATTVNGKRMPVDDEPVPDGNADPVRPDPGRVRADRRAVRRPRAELLLDDGRPAIHVALRDLPERRPAPEGPHHMTTAAQQHPATRSRRSAGPGSRPSSPSNKPAPSRRSPRRYRSRNASPATSTGSAPTRRRLRRLRARRRRVLGAAQPRAGPVGAPRPRARRDLGQRRLRGARAAPRRRAGHVRGAGVLLGHAAQLPRHPHVPGAARDHRHRQAHPRAVAAADRRPAGRVPEQSERRRPGDA